MAFQTGSQINPALGRVDYSPYMQGVVSGSQAYMQGAAAGAQSIGQGIASLGQSIGSGIEQFYKKKEQKQQEDQATAFVGNLVKSDDRVARFLGLQRSETGEYDEKALRAGIKSVGAPAILNLANNFQMMEQEQLREQELRNQQIKTNSALNDIISKNYDKKTRKVNVSAVYQGAAKLGVAPEAIAKTMETLAKVNEVKQPDLSFPEQRVQAEVNAFTKRTGNLPNEQEMAQIMDKVARGSVAQPEDPDLKLRVESFGKEVDTLIEGGRVARQVAPQVETLLTLINSGKLDTGALEDLKRSGRSFAKAAGLPVDEEKLASAEQARAMFGRMILEYFQQTKGSISNAENQLFQSFGPELGKSEAANKAILVAAKKRLELDRDLEKIARDFRMEKFDRIKAQELIQSKLSKYDEELTSLLPASPAPAGGGMKNIVVDY